MIPCPLCRDPVGCPACGPDAPVEATVLGCPQFQQVYFSCRSPSHRGHPGVFHECAPALTGRLKAPRGPLDAFLGKTGSG